MTGYGRSSHKRNHLDLTVEAKSFNHRFLDITMNLPKQLSYLEDQVKRQVREIASRGKFDLYISLDEEESKDVEVIANSHLMEQYLRKLDALSEKYHIENDIKLSHLIQLPDFFSIKEEKKMSDDIEGFIIQTVHEALDYLVRMRKTEGQHLKEDILLRLDNLMNHIDELMKLAPTVSQQYKHRLYKKMEEILGQQVDFDEQRLLTEVALFADKSNVDEELTRLGSHVRQFKIFLEQEDPVGRRLDFLIQEMNREINTIGSKGNSIHISRLVVEIKSELEKIREQVQNIE